MYGGSICFQRRFGREPIDHSRAEYDWHATNMKRSQTLQFSAIWLLCLISFVVLDNNNNTSIHHTPHAVRSNQSKYEQITWHGNTISCTILLQVNLHGILRRNRINMMKPEMLNCRFFAIFPKPVSAEAVPNLLQRINKTLVFHLNARDKFNQFLKNRFWK